MARLSSEQQEEVVRLYRSKKYSIKEILALTGVGSEQTVYRIIAGRDDVEMMRRTSPTKKYSVNLDTEAVKVLDTVNPRNISQWINDLIVKAGEDLVMKIETSKVEQAKEVLQGLGLEYRLSREQIKKRWASMKYPSLDYNYPSTKELIDSAINFTLQKTNYFTLDGGTIEIEVGMKDRKKVIAALKELGIEVKDRAKKLTTLTEQLQEQIRQGSMNEDIQAELRRLGKSSRHYYTVAYEVLNTAGYRFNPTKHPASLEQSKWAETFKETGDRRTLKSNLDLLEEDDTDKLGTLIEGILYSVHSES
jgi:hypothetical protein